MSTSERQVRATPAASGPREACTTHIESSTVTTCWPAAGEVASRCGPGSAGSAPSSAVTTCERLSLVETCTVRSALRIAASVTSVSGVADDEVAAHARRTPCASPSRSARIASTVSRPCSRGGSKPNSLLQGVEEVVAAPSPRCPWCGRPARWSDRGPGTARRRACRCCPAAAATLTISLIVGDGVAVLGDAHRPADDGARRDVANMLGGRLDLRRGSGRSRASTCVPVEVARRARRTPRSPSVCRVDEVVVERAPAGPRPRAAAPIAWNSARSPLTRIGRNRSARSVPRAGEPARRLRVLERASARPRGSGLIATIFAPFCLAFSSAVSIRGWLVPGFWPDDHDQLGLVDVLAG